MTLLAKTGSFLTPTSTGDQSYTGVGFTPRVIIYFTNRQEDNNTGSDAFQMIGWDTYNNVGTNGHSRATFANDAAATTSTVNGWAPGSVGLMVDNTASTALNNSLVSMDLDGFTLNWATVEATRRPIHYLALGGSSVLAFAGDFDTGLGAANVSVTGVGFQPKITLFVTSRATTASGWSGSTSSHIVFGAAVSSSSRWSAGNLSRDGFAAADNDQRIETDFVQFIMGVGGVLQNTLDFVSHDADGFTIDPVTAYTADTNIAFLCLGGDGLLAAVGTETQKTSTGTKATTGVGFAPHALIFAGNAATSVGATPGGVSAFFGVAASTSDQRACAVSDTDTADPTEVKASTAGSKCLHYISGPTPTTDAEASLSSIESDGYTLNWTTADATGRTFGWIALANFDSATVSATTTYSFSATASAAAIRDVTVAAIVRFAGAFAVGSVWALNLTCAWILSLVFSQTTTEVPPESTTPVSGGGGSMGGGAALGSNMRRRIGWFRRRSEWTKR